MAIYLRLLCLGAILALILNCYAISLIVTDPRLPKQLWTKNGPTTIQTMCLAILFSITQLCRILYWLLSNEWLD